MNVFWNQERLIEQGKLREQAQILRREWMALIGCDSEEIREHVESPECCNPEHEQENLEAARRLQKCNLQPTKALAEQVRDGRTDVKARNSGENNDPPRH